MNKLNLNYMQPQSARGYRYLVVPKELIENPAYSGLDFGAIILYAKMLERAGLSARNEYKFSDKNGRLFIIYTVEQMERDLQRSHPTIIKLTKQLADIGLIQKVRQGQGKPSKIYIMDFTSAPHSELKKTKGKGTELQEVKDFNFKKSRGATSRSKEAELQEVKDFNPIELENKELEDIELPPYQPSARFGDGGAEGIVEDVREQIEYDVLREEYGRIFWNSYITAVKIRRMTEMAIKGVDISENNPVVDFEKLKAAGVKFALIRCGYGNDDVSQDDSRFFENIRKAKAAGVPYGVYLYSYALTVAEARSEAAHTLRLLKQIDHPAYGVWFDMEDGDGYKARMGMPSNSTLVDICDIYCRELQNAGYYVGIYASLSWFNNKLNDSRLDRYDKWVAQWNSTCDYKKPYGIWQYTDKFMVGGYPFDANWAYKDYPLLTGAKKEETILTEEQARKLVHDEYNKLNPIYNTLADVPSYWRADIEKLMDLGVIAGVGNGKLGLTRSEAKSAVIALRLAEQFFERNEN